MTPDHFTVGIVAPSSQIPRVELQLGVERLKQAGLRVKIHPQCKKSHLFFAGTDEERANAIFEFAQNSELHALWCARGGYGSIRTLPFLRELTKKHGIPAKKILIGFSDTTAIMTFVRQEWNWATLHAMQPGTRLFGLLNPADWRATIDWAMGQSTPAPWRKCRLSFWTPPPPASLTGPLIGGNLTVWTSVLGTPFENRVHNCLLFFEDVTENLYRIDRMVQQLYLAGRFEGVKAIVLGNFFKCEDSSAYVLAAPPLARNRIRVLQTPKPSELKPLRKVLAHRTGLRKIFGELGEKLGVPVAFGLPVGHGPGISPLPLGAEYTLSPEGSLEMIHWDWLKI